MFDGDFTFATFPGNEKKTDIINESKIINSTQENYAKTRRITRRYDSNTDRYIDTILPPFGYDNVWGG
jgi:hypothetical protein